VPKRKSRPQTPFEVLAEAYDKYRSELRQYIRRLACDPHGIDDLMQEVWLALRKIPATLSIEDPRGLLFCLAWRVSQTANRRRGKDAAKLISIEAEEFAEPTCGLTGENSDSIDHIDVADVASNVATLPPDLRYFVTRHYFDKKTYIEMAGELGCSWHTVKKYVQKALRQLRKHWGISNAD
jgi:RNA polymerase sigma factor (sigma-70 family)